MTVAMSNNIVLQRSSMTELLQQSTNLIWYFSGFKKIQQILTAYSHLPCLFVSSELHLIPWVDLVNQTIANISIQVGSFHFFVNQIIKLAWKFAHQKTKFESQSANSSIEKLSHKVFRSFFLPIRCSYFVLEESAKKLSAMINQLEQPVFSSEIPSIHTILLLDHIDPWKNLLTFHSRSLSYAKIRYNWGNANKWCKCFYWSRPNQAILQQMIDSLRLFDSRFQEKSLNGNYVKTIFGQVLRSNIERYVR